MTYTVICYKITLEKHICVSRTIVMISCKYEGVGDIIMVTDPFLLGCIGFDDCNVYLLAFKLSTLY